jgi:carbon monoxide dehydrogenase subunit G
MRVSGEIDIQRPPAEVFAYLARHENHRQFIAENISCEQLTPGTLAVGSRVRNVARLLGREMVELFEIVEFDPPRAIGKASLPGSTYQTADRFELEPHGAGTRVRLTVTGTPHGLAQRALRWVIEPLVRRSTRAALARLKRILEGDGLS